MTFPSRNLANVSFRLLWIMEYELYKLKILLMRLKTIIFVSQLILFSGFVCFLKRRGKSRKDMTDAGYHKQNSIEGGGAK